MDSGAAIARRTAWLLEHEAPDAKSADANIAFCMAIIARFTALRLRNARKTGSFRLIWLNVARSENYFKFPLVRPE